MERIASAVGTLSQGSGAFRKPREALGALLKLLSCGPRLAPVAVAKADPGLRRQRSRQMRAGGQSFLLSRRPAALWWVFFAIAQGSYLLSGGRYVQGGSQRLSSALARAIKVAGGEVLVRRVVSGIVPDLQGHSSTVTHTARDGTDAQVVECVRIVGNAAPAALAPLMPAAAAEKLTETRPAAHAIDFAVRAHARPVETAARIRVLGLFDAAAAAGNGAAVRLCARHSTDGGGTRETNAADVDRRLRRDRFRVPAPPYVLLICGPDQLSNWDSSDMDAYREKRGRWQQAIVGYLSSVYPGLADAVVASSFNTALSVRQYLNAPDGAVYGFAPTPPRSIWRVPVRFAAHGGARGLSGVSLCGFRRL